MAMLGMFVLGFAFEKLSGQMTAVSILGFAAAIVHASAWWFTFHAAAPWKRFLFCGLLLAAAMACGLAGRWAHFQMDTGTPEALFENLPSLISRLAAWWLVSVGIYGVAKFGLRWELIRDNIQLSTTTTITDLLQVTAIVGVVITVAKPEMVTSIGADDRWILMGSVLLQILILIPLAMVTVRPLRSRKSKAISIGVAGVLIFSLMLIAMSGFLSEDFSAIAAVAVGLISLIFPFYVMLLAARESRFALMSQWCNSDEF